jgi:hypothetical protein
VIAEPLARSGLLQRYATLAAVVLAEQRQAVAADCDQPGDGAGTELLD